MLLNNPYFWLGEIGLLLTVISCLVFIHQLRHEHFIQVLAFWFGLIMALTMLVRPAVINFDHSIPIEPYLYRLSIGIVFACRCYVYLKGVNRSKNPDEVRMGVNILRWASIAGTLFLTYLVYKLRNR